MTTPLQKAAQALMDALVQTDFTCRLGEQLDACEKALDAEIAQSVEPVAWHPTEAAITALKRFEETCTDNEGYDVPKDTMRNLQAIGLIYRTYGDMYCITDFGRHILASPPANAEQAQPVEPVSKPSLYIHKLGLAFLRAAHGDESTPVRYANGFPSWIPDSVKAKHIPLYLHPPQPQAKTPLNGFDMRGVLASNLLCWMRLTEAEAQDLVYFFEKFRTAKGEKP